VWLIVVVMSDYSKSAGKSPLFSGLRYLGSRDLLKL